MQLTQLIDTFLFYAALAIAGVSVVVSFKTRFVQFRMLPAMVRGFWASVKSSEEKGALVVPHKAMLAAMSTTLGISTMISPAIAISCGGPGALLGYLLTTIFGSAVTFSEVRLAVAHRKETVSGVMGGPMPYLEAFFSKKLAAFYAFFGLLMAAAWSGAQANQLAAILNGQWAVPHVATGLLFAGVVAVMLLGGFRSIASFSSKIVPIMFVLYVGASLWIVAANIGQLPALFALVIRSACIPQEFASGALLGGLVTAMRWGIFKGVHSNEVGLGTQAIPNSMAAADPVQQGILAMASTYSSGAVAILSGLVALITNTWQDPTLGLGIGMVAASYQIYFSSAGPVIVALCAILFGVGTMLGNSYNGGHCFQYLAGGRFRLAHILASVVVIFLGAVCGVSVFWGWADIVVALVAVPHVLALMAIVCRSEPRRVLADSSSA